MMLREYPKLLDHPEYYHGDEKRNVVLNDDAPAEAQAMFEEYTAWRKENENPKYDL